MDINDAIKLLEFLKKNDNLKITKVEYYEQTDLYKQKVLKGNATIKVQYEESDNQWRTNKITNNSCMIF